MNLQAKSLLISLAIHIGVACLVITTSSPFTHPNKTIAIDLTIPDSRGSNSPGNEKRGGKSALETDNPVGIKNKKTAFARKAHPSKLEPTNQHPAPSPVTKPVKTAPAAEPVKASSTARTSTPGVISTGASVKEAPSGGTGSGRAGGSGGSGTGQGQAASGTGSGNSAEQLRKRYLAEQFEYIKKVIEKNIKYPSRALRMGWTGKILVSFTILENGHVTNMKILSSSGYDLLDDNLLHTIKSVEPFPKPPVSAQLKIPIIYRLEQ